MWQWHEMKKLKPIILLIALGLLTSSFIRPGQLGKIVNCQLKFDHKGIFPGNLVDVVLETTLKDSTVIPSTRSNLTINFADYVFELEGGAVVHEKTRTKLVLLIQDDSYTNPFVEISVHLRRKKSINWKIKLPILYDVTQVVNFSGKDGYDPRANSDNGYKKIPITSRVNIEYIDNSQTLTNNSDPNIIGGKGPDLEVYVSLITAEDGEKFVQVDIRSEDGDRITKYLKAGVGSLEIQSVGGKGGISRFGGKGGDGGNVTVFIKPNARPYFNQIFIVNHGGDGGELWRPKIDGQQQGPYGDDGDLEIYDWE